MPVPAQRNPVLQDCPKALFLLEELAMDARLFAMPTVVKVSRLAELTGTSREDVARLLALLVREGYVYEARRNGRGSPCLMLATNVAAHPPRWAA